MPNRFMGRPEYLEKMRKISAQLRLHPTRSFFPGQTYNPEAWHPARFCLTAIRCPPVWKGQDSAGRQSRSCSCSVMQSCALKTGAAGPEYEGCPLMRHAGNVMSGEMLLAGAGG